MTKTYDPFDNEFQRVMYNEQNVLGDKFFNVGVSFIEKFGEKESQTLAHKITRSNVGKRLYSAITDRVELGSCRLLESSDRWKLVYQIGFQTFEGNDNDHWWRITRKIIGTRPGKKFRSFEAHDFKETQKIFDGLNREMSNNFQQFKAAYESVRE